MLLAPPDMLAAPSVKLLLPPWVLLASRLSMRGVTWGGGGTGTGGLVSERSDAGGLGFFCVEAGLHAPV